MDIVERLKWPILREAGDEITRLRQELASALEKNIDLVVHSNIIIDENNRLKSYIENKYNEREILENLYGDI